MIMDIEAIDNSIKILEEKLELIKLSPCRAFGEEKTAYINAITGLEELKRIETLKKNKRLIELPCAIGDYAELNNGDKVKVVDVSIGKEYVNVLLDNGATVCLDYHYNNWVKRFIHKGSD